MAARTGKITPGGGVDMDGQWIGRVEGDVPGLGVLELDDNGDHLDGIAYHFPDDTKLPSVAAYIRTPNRELKQSLREARLLPVQPDLGVYLSHHELGEYFPDTVVADKVDIEIEFDAEAANFAYKTEFTKGNGRLIKSRANEPSELLPIADVKTWEKFRNEALSVEPNRFLYRGQSTKSRLRTSFHRTKRKSLARYRDDDLSQVRRALSPLLNHVFDQKDSIQTGALYNLIQHHGFPTPLLDWSLSPFVAAFFAYRSKPRGRPESDCVRIFAFDHRRWQNDFPRSGAVAFSRPHFSVIDLLAIENPRMIPQQATSTITNIDDIESYISFYEKHSGKSYLTAIDLPLSERQQTLSELSLMGINAGSMFPGIDGACEALAYRSFGA